MQKLQSKLLVSLRSVFDTTRSTIATFHSCLLQDTSVLEFQPYVRIGDKSGYLAFIKLALIRIWLRAYTSTP
jgi:hypothetical protein